MSSQVHGRSDMDDRANDIYEKIAASFGITEEEARRKLLEAGYGGTSLYDDVAEKLGIPRHEAKARVLEHSYNLVKPSPLEQVRDFHAKFGLPGLEQDETRDLDDHEALFRVNFMLEELSEYAECSGFIVLADYLKDVCVDLSRHLRGEIDIDIAGRDGDSDRHGQLDALVDLSYVLHGTAVMQGFRRFDEAFAKVHRANMTKIRAESADQSKRGTRLDVVKPPGWSAPVLTEYL